MRYLKYFSIFEAISDFNRIGDWVISYNHKEGHDLDNKMSERTGLLDKIINIIEKDGLDKIWVFVSI